MLEILRESLAVLEPVGIDKAPEIVIKARANVALFAAGDGNAAEAEALFQKVIGDAEAAFGTDSYLTGTVLRSYALFLRHQKCGREARIVEDRAARILAASARKNFLGSTVEASALLMKQ